MGYLKLKSVLQRYFLTPNINYSNLNYFTRDGAGALRAPMSAIFWPCHNLCKKRIQEKNTKDSVNSVQLRLDPRKK